MTTSGIAAVAALNALFLLVGYSLLAAPLRGLSPLTWASFAGVALMTGAAAVGVVLCMLVVFGFTTGFLTFAATAVALAVGGTLAGGFLPPRHVERIRFPTVTPRRPGLVEAILATAAATFVAGVCVLTLIAASRSSPWLDDAYSFWLPKGLFLSTQGLDERVFTPSEVYVEFIHPDYPLWWSIVGGAEMGLARRVELPALNAQIAIVLIAFVAAVARLLWGRVRTVILWVGLAMLVVSAELLHQTQSGGADVPLAVYLALTVLASVLWLLSGDAFFVGIVAVAGAATMSIKVEGMPQLVVLVGLPALVLLPIVRRRVAVLLVALAAAWATSVPWLGWRARHGVPSQFSLRDAFDPAYLAERTERVGPSLEAVAASLVGRDWPLIVPAFLALTLVGFALERRALWLLPAAIFAACVGFWVWTYSAGSVPLDFWLSTSAYRVVDGLLLTTAVMIPLMAERIVGVGRGPTTPT